MQFPMKIQPIDSDGAIIADHPKPVAKSRLKRLFERQFSSVRRTSSSDKHAGSIVDLKDKDRDGGGDLEPNSVALDKMVQSFMEDSNDKPSSVRNHRCNCFQGNWDDSSDDDLELAARNSVDSPIISAVDAADALKGLNVCASVTERNLAADASTLLEKIKNSKGKEESRKILTAGLKSLGFNAAICKSRWEKTPSYPAGEHKYIDVIVDGDERILIDIDFRSEFEIARSTKCYRALLQSLPLIFVGTADRVAQIVSVVSEAARQSLKKKELHFPPWRQPEYMRAKWLAPHEREVCGAISAVELDDEKVGRLDEGEDVTWQLPAVRPKAGQKVVTTGLSEVLGDQA